MNQKRIELAHIPDPLGLTPGPAPPAGRVAPLRDLRACSAVFLVSASSCPQR